jgi:hypothetical protein
MPFGGNCIPLEAGDQGKNVGLENLSRDANVHSGSRIALAPEEFMPEVSAGENARQRLGS